MTWQQLFVILFAAILGAVAYGLAWGRRPEPWYASFPFFCGVFVFGLMMVLIPLWVK